MYDPSNYNIYTVLASTQAIVTIVDSGFNVLTTVCWRTADAHLMVTWLQPSASIGLGGSPAYCHLFDEVFIKPDAKSQRLLFHVIVIYWQHIQYFYCPKVNLQSITLEVCWGQ